MGWARVPDLGWDRVSAKVVQRLDAPVARIQSARRAGLAWAAVRLVTAYTVTVRQRRLGGDRARRVMRIAWVAWGMSRPATVVTWRRRVSTLPWPRSWVWSSTGMSCQGRILSCW